MQSNSSRLAALAGAALFVATLFAPASPGMASSKQRQYTEHTLMCLKLFFDNPAEHARQCPGSVGPDLRSIGPGGDGGVVNKVPDDCDPIEGGGESGGVASDPCVKQDISFLTEAGGLRFYRFAYVGDDHIYYGVMARELLADPRFAAAVHLSATGYYTVDYEALGLIVPEEAAMRAAGLRAMELVAARHRG